MNWSVRDSMNASAVPLRSCASGSPRETLLTALKSESQLLNTDDLPKSELVNVEVIRPFAS